MSWNTYLDINKREFVKSFRVRPPKKTMSKRCRLLIIAAIKRYTYKDYMILIALRRIVAF